MGQGPSESGGRAYCVLSQLVGRRNVPERCVTWLVSGGRREEGGGWEYATDVRVVLLLGGANVSIAARVSFFISSPSELEKHIH